MKPILFHIFGIPIYGYGTMIALGICAALFLVSYRGKKKGYDEDSILNLAIIAIVMGLLGGKLLYIITDIKSIITDKPPIFDIISGGFVIYGAIIGGALGVYIYSKHKKWDMLKIYDMVVPTVALAQGFGRIGCFLAGCCYGKTTHLTIGVVFKNSNFAPSGEPLQPTQIYSSIFDFCLAIFLVWFDRKERKKGRVFSLYIIIYSIGRFLVEFLRDDPRGNIGALSTSQFIGIFTLIFGIIIFNIDKIKKSSASEMVINDGELQVEVDDNLNVNHEQENLLLEDLKQDKQDEVQQTLANEDKDKE